MKSALPCLVTRLSDHNMEKTGEFNQEKGPEMDADGNPIIHPKDAQIPTGSGVLPPPGTQQNGDGREDMNKKVNPDDSTKKLPPKQTPKCVNTPKGPNPPTDPSPTEIIDEILDGDPKKGKGGTKKCTQSAKNPTLQVQLTELMSKLDQQKARTDELYNLVRPPPQTTPPGLRHAQSHPNRRHHGDRHASRHVLGSHYKRGSPRSGRRTLARSHRETSRHSRYSPPESSNSSTSDIEAQVSQALDMMEPRFASYKGKPQQSDDSIKSYRPFAFLEREKQREIIRHGHPEELTFVQHLTGLCVMAQEYTDDRCKAYWVLQHVIQLLEDHEFIQWNNTRAFSNTVISNIARGKWSWDDEKLIERCRTNNYMRRRAYEESQWSVPCPKFNKGRCDKQESHQVGQVTMRHVCTHCAMNGYENPHTLRACSRRKGTTSAQNQQKANGEEKREYRGAKSYSNYRHDNSSEGSKN